MENWCAGNFNENVTKRRFWDSQKIHYREMRKFSFWYILYRPNFQSANRCFGFGLGKIKIQKISLVDVFFFVFFLFELSIFCRKVNCVSPESIATLMNYSISLQWFFNNEIVLSQWNGKLLTLSSSGWVRVPSETRWKKPRQFIHTIFHAPWKFTTRAAFEWSLMLHEIVMTSSFASHSPLNDPMYRFPMMCHNSGSPVFLAMIKCCLQGETSKCVIRPPGTVMQRICDGRGTGSQPVKGTNCQNIYVEL